MNIKDYSEIKLEAFSYSNTTDLAKLLLSGQNTFEILIDMMITAEKDLECTNELYLEEDTEKENGQPFVKSKVMNVDTAFNRTRPPEMNNYMSLS